MAIKVTLAEARAAKKKVEALVAGLPEVNGVGITRLGDSFAVKLNLMRRLETAGTLPKDIDGVRIRVEVVGPITGRS